MEQLNTISSKFSTLFLRLIFFFRCGAENATDEEMIEAAKIANALDFILKSEFSKQNNFSLFMIFFRKS